MATKTKPSVRFNPRDWGIGVDTDNSVPPPDPQSRELLCSITGTKPRFVSEDGSFAIWSARWEGEAFEEAARRQLEELKSKSSQSVITTKMIERIERELAGERPGRDITVKGPLARVSSGEMLRCKGGWKSHDRYGWSFQVADYSSALPQTAEGVAAWLEHRVDGIGPTFAKAIVKHFGAESVFSILDEDPSRLREVRTPRGRKIPEGQVEKAIGAWDDVKAIRQIETFLFGRGVSANLAARLYREYGEEVVEILETDPYQITSLRGIGFRIADDIARAGGTPLDDPSRIEAGMLYVLEEAQSSGHVYLGLEQLIGAAQSALEIDSPTPIAEAGSRLSRSGRIVAEEDEHLQQRIYSKRLHEIECRLARKIREMTSPAARPLYPKPDRPTAPEGATPEQIEALLLPTDQQWEVAEDVRNQRLTIMTGGPGVGKTASVDMLVKLADEHNLRLALCAPTGKAARRMSELTGHPASTIHRLLEFNPFEGGFQRNEHNPLEVDLLIVDEASMLSLDLADNLFRAIPDEAHVLLVGDPDQLPPVGAGKVLDDLIETRAVPMVRLTRIFRQAARSMIIQNSRLINAGKLPFLRQQQAEAALQQKMLDDFYWVTRSTPEATLELALEMATKRIPRTFGFDPVHDLMVLAPMRKGTVGLEQLNLELEQLLNPGPDGKPKKPILPHRGICVGSRIIQNKNFYHPEGMTKSVMNGEMAIVTDYDPEKKEALLALDDGEREIWVPTVDMETYTLAWAISVHKSQGSSFPAVLFVLSSSHYTMLTRGLAYTALTRAEKLCVMVGDKRALSMAVDKPDMRRRNSTLGPRIIDPHISGELL